MFNNTLSLTACQTADSIGLERTRFFARQLIGQDDLTQDQLYFREKMRRHNRLLHGWGVVCGARVRGEGPESCRVIVEPGFILGPYGDEILIDREVVVDLCQQDPDGNAVSPCASAASTADPWCSDVRVDRPVNTVLYLAICYAECQTRPVRVQTNGCGCSDAECEYSRIRDSFTIRALTRLPDSYLPEPLTTPDINEIGAVFCPSRTNEQAFSRACPDCPTEPWVILAAITMAGGGTVGDINCFSHRRYVVSFADYFFVCGQPDRRLLSSYTVLEERPVAGVVTPEPAVLVAVKRPSGESVYLPISFAVQPGDTYATLLAREGQREYLDRASGESFTLAELYATAGVDPAAPVAGVAAAVAPLEGLTIRTGALRDVTRQLGGLLSASGRRRLVRDFAGAPQAAAQLKATDLQGISPQSALGRKLKEMDLSIEQVAAQPKDKFLESLALEQLSARSRPATEQQAGEIWDQATQIMAVIQPWQT